jgi:hypothetical protein
MTSFLRVWSQDVQSGAKAKIPWKFSDRRALLIVIAAKEGRPAEAKALARSKYGMKSELAKGIPCSLNDF